VAPYCIPNERIGFVANSDAFSACSVSFHGIVSQAMAASFAAGLHLTGNHTAAVNVANCVRVLPSFVAGLLLIDNWNSDCDGMRRTLQWNFCLRHSSLQMKS